MRISSFNVSNYRNITSVCEVSLASYTLLIGPNNEGKSNLLHALALGMAALGYWHPKAPKTANGRVRYPGFWRATPRLLSPNMDMGIRYNWATDFPVHMQGSGRTRSATKIALSFALTRAEQTQLRKTIDPSISDLLSLEISFDRDSFGVTITTPDLSATPDIAKNGSFVAAKAVCRAMSFEYVPAIRTADSALWVASSLIRRGLSVLDNDQAYKSAVKEVKRIQQPIIRQLETSVRDMVKQLIPTIEGISISNDADGEVTDLYRNWNFQSTNIVVDDGQQTVLERKGDGVQSMVVLALMQRASMQVKRGVKTVFAIEEPESHLHPDAVRKCASVVAQLSKRNQVVLASHSPLLVDPNDLDRTVIVRSSGASVA